MYEDGSLYVYVHNLTYVCKAWTVPPTRTISPPPPLAFQQPLPPPPISSVNAYELGFGLTCGVCAGVFVKKGAKALAFVFGGLFVFLQVCIHSPYERLSCFTFYLVSQLYIHDTRRLGTDIIAFRKAYRVHPGS